jgi:peptidoglycan/xylan/chitin deacetylase (PgdA/CDA1 family)
MIAPRATVAQRRTKPPRQRIVNGIPGIGLTDHEPASALEPAVKHLVFRLGLTALARTGAARIAAPVTRGAGAILMFHHVRPHAPRAFEPNRILEITPEFLDATLTHVKRRGYEIIPIGALRERLANPRGRFVVLTFDDGYRDNLVHALPVLDAHRAPFTIFVTTGFADRTATMWWADLEEALDRLPEATIDGRRMALSDPAAKTRAFGHVAAMIRRQPWEDSRTTLDALAAIAGVDGAARVDRYCLDWTEIRALDQLDLCTIAAHTLTHPLLARMRDAEAMHEISASKARLEEMLARPIQHFAYPVGDPSAAGPREFQMTAEAGFATAVTTRPGVLFPEHAAHADALPRVSINGLYQSIQDVDVLLSGAAFALFNRGRRINVG